MNSTSPQSPTFELTWGYAIAGRSPERYQAFLKRSGTEVAALIKIDAEGAAGLKPSRADLRDAVIAAYAKRHNAAV